MNNQPEALRLAEALERLATEWQLEPDGNTMKTANELRRQHELLEELRGVAKKMDEYMSGSTAWTRDQEDELKQMVFNLLEKLGPCHEL